MSSRMIDMSMIPLCIQSVAATVVKIRPGIHTCSSREKHDGFLNARLTMSSQMIDMTRAFWCIPKRWAESAVKGAAGIHAERNVTDS